MRKKRRRALSILEAVDHLSNLAEVDAQTQDDSIAKEEIISAEKSKNAFETINHYLHHLYEKDQSELSDPETQRGVKAMMSLAGEAVRRVEKLPKALQQKMEIDQAMPEYQQLHQFYLSKIVSRLRKSGAISAAWAQELEMAASAGDKEAQTLKNLETVRQDKDYELFYLKQEDGLPFFSVDVIRHLRLVGDFDESLNRGEVENLFVTIEHLHDRDLQLSAREVLADVSSQLRDFYSFALQHKQDHWVAPLNQACMALMLAANPGNLKRNHPQKSSSLYFRDFINYLRDALQSKEYEKIKQNTGKNPSPVYLSALRLTQELCQALWIHIGDRDGFLKLIEETIPAAKHLDQDIWSNLLQFDDQLRQQLKDLPSGPLLKILSALRNEEEKDGFDPFLHGNLPYELFTIEAESLQTICIHVPSPLRQNIINQAQALPELHGFLDSLGDQCHCLINFQNRTSWKEHYRSLALEAVASDTKYQGCLQQLTLTKDTDFYHQLHEYAQQADSAEFCLAFEEQLQSGHLCGFDIPKSLFEHQKLNVILQFVLESFFANQKQLNRKERLDFIEITYYFLQLLFFDQQQPHSISFTCKDGVDIGSAAAAMFFGCTRMLSSAAPWTFKEQQFFEYSLYKPPLFQRFRSIDKSRLQRSISALAYFNQMLVSQRDMILKQCAKLFPHISLQSLKIHDVA